MSLFIQKMWSFLQKHLHLSSSPKTKWRGTLIVVATVATLIIVWTQRRRRRDIEVNEDGVPETREGGGGSEEEVPKVKQSYEKEPAMYFPRGNTSARTLPSYAYNNSSGFHRTYIDYIDFKTLEGVPIIVRKYSSKTFRKNDNDGWEIPAMDNIRRANLAVAQGGTREPWPPSRVETQMDSGIRPEEIDDDESSSHSSEMGIRPPTHAVFLIARRGVSDLFQPEETIDDEVSSHSSEIERDQLDELDSSEEEQEDMVTFQRQYNAASGQIPDHSAVVMINPDDFMAGLASGPSQTQSQGQDGELSLYVELDEPSNFPFGESIREASQIDSSQNRNSLFDLITQEFSAGSPLQNALGEGDSSWVEESSFDLTENVP